MAGLHRTRGGERGGAVEFFSMEQSGFFSFFIALFFGLLSFASPCVLPLVPGYLCYLSGVSYDELTGEESTPALRRRVVWHSLFFVMGFTILFVFMGAFASNIGRFLADHQEIVRRTAGAIIFLLGFQFLEIIKFNLFSKMEHKMDLKTHPAGYLGSIVTGMAFGAGWTPCVGAFLGSILALAATAETVGKGMLLLMAYSLGLGIPFVLAAFAVDAFMRAMRKYRRFMPWVTRGSGLLLMAVGALIFFDRFSVLSAFLTRWIPFHEF